MSERDEWEREYHDLRASDAEHSHMSGEARRQIDEIIGEEVAAGAGRPAGTDAIAQRIVRELPGAELEGLIRDWLEGKARQG